VSGVPEVLSPWHLALSDDGCQLVYTYDPRSTRTGIPDLLKAVGEAGLKLKDFKTTQSSLEDIFVNLVKGK
jgi:ABC-2 type transport system ATP-binding protein